MIKYHQMIAYTRFEFSDKGILWTKIPDEFNPYIINHFAEKFPDFYILIEHKNITYSFKKGQKLISFEKNVKEVLINFEKILNKDFNLKLNNSSELWNAFYDSQYIKTRKNKKLFHHFIPKKLKSVEFLQKEFDAIIENKKLNEFLKK